MSSCWPCRHHIGKASSIESSSCWRCGRSRRRRLCRTPAGASRSFISSPIRAIRRSSTTTDMEAKRTISAAASSTSSALMRGQATLRAKRSPRSGCRDALAPRRSNVARSSPACRDALRPLLDVSARASTAISAASTAGARSRTAWPHERPWRRHLRRTAGVFSDAGNKAIGSASRCSCATTGRRSSSRRKSHSIRRIT